MFSFVRNYIVEATGNNISGRPKHFGKIFGLNHELINLLEKWKKQLVFLFPSKAVSGVVNQDGREKVEIR